MSTTVVNDAERLVRLPAVLSLTGLSQAGVYRGMKAKTFPQHITLGPNARAWRLREIQAWIADRIAARDTGADADLRTVNPNIGKGRQPKQHAHHAP